MSAERSGKSPAMAWTLTMLATIVFYFLSFPPVNAFAAQCTIRGWTGPQVSPQSDWLHVYGSPYCFVAGTTPLGKSLAAYNAWWWKLLVG